MLLPDRFHREAMDNGHVSEQSLASLGRAAIFCINGQVRPEMAALQRARRSGTDREALARDADTASHLPGRIVGDMALGALRLTHEPEAQSADDDRRGEVAGHLHPAAKVAAYGRGVRRPCFVTDGSRIVLPAFGAFTGGLNVRDPAIADLFAAPPMAAALGRDRVHALDWAILR